MKKRMDLSPDRPWTPACDIVLRQLAGEGMSAQEIGAILNRRPESVARRLRVVCRRPAPSRPDASAEAMAWARRTITGLGRVC